MMNPIEEEPPPLSTPTPPSSPDRAEVEAYSNNFYCPETQAIMEPEDFPPGLLEYFSRPIVTPQVTPEPDRDAILDNIQNEAAEILRASEPEPIQVFAPDLTTTTTVVTSLPVEAATSFASMNETTVAPPDLIASCSSASATIPPMDSERARALANREIGLEECEKNSRISYKDCMAWYKEIQVNWLLLLRRSRSLSLPKTRLTDCVFVLG